MALAGTGTDPRPEGSALARCVSSVDRTTTSDGAASPVAKNSTHGDQCPDPLTWPS